MSGKMRKSLQQYRAEAAVEAVTDPWACPRCGCKDWRTVDTRLISGVRKRQRACRNCKQSLPTQEVPVPDGFTLMLVPRDEDAA